MVSNTAFQYMVLGLVLSIGLNVLTIMISLGFGIGQRVVRRLKRRWLYKKGHHVNVIFLRRNHVSDELFVKKESDGSFKIDGQRYTVNPLTTFIHDGIPTQINKEGEAEAFNIYNNPDARNMSTAELENVIMANEVNDLANTLKKMMPMIIIFMLVVCGFILFSAYMNWKVFDAIAQKHILDQMTIIAQNVTSVTPR